MLNVELFSGLRPAMKNYSILNWKVELQVSEQPRSVAAEQKIKIKTTKVCPLGLQRMEKAFKRTKKTAIQ